MRNARSNSPFWVEQLDTVIGRPNSTAIEHLASAVGLVVGIEVEQGEHLVGGIRRPPCIHRRDDDLRLAKTPSPQSLLMRRLSIELFHWQKDTSS